MLREYIQHPGAYHQRPPPDSSRGGTGRKLVFRTARKRSGLQRAFVKLTIPIGAQRFGLYTFAHGKKSNFRQCATHTQMRLTVRKIRYFCTVASCFFLYHTNLIPALPQRHMSSLSVLSRRVSLEFNKNYQ